MFSFRRYIAVTKKEFLELRRNRLFFIMTILAPIIFYFLFAYGFPLDAKNIPTGVVDFDKSAASRRLIDSFENATDLFKIKMITDNYAPAQRQMDLGNLRFMLVIPHDFERHIDRGVTANLQAIIDGAYPNTANLIVSNVETIVAYFGFDVLTNYLMTRPGFEGGGLTFTPIDLSASAWYNSSFRSEDFIIPAIIAIVMVFLPPIVASISLAKEKETGSILNMYCSSIRKAEYLFGKLTPYVLISYLNFLLFLVLSVYLFEVPLRGSIMAILVSAALYIQAVLAIGLLVAVFVKSQVAAILITFVGTVMPAFLYTGFMVPMSSMDESAQQTGMCLPTTYFIDLARKVMVKGANFMTVRTDVIVLAAFCFILYFLCIKFFKKRIG